VLAATEYARNRSDEDAKLGSGVASNDGLRPDPQLVAAAEAHAVREEPESEELKEQASVSIVDAMPSPVNLLNDASPPSADQLSESSQPRRRLRSNLNEAAAAESPVKKSRRVGSPRAVSVSTLVPQAQTLSTNEQRAHMQEWFKKHLPWIRTNLLRGSRSDPRTILAKGPIHDKWQTLWKHCEMWLKGQNDNNEDSDRM
jgi:hypothetical protein